MAIQLLLVVSLVIILVSALSTVVILTTLEKGGSLKVDLTVAFVLGLATTVVHLTTLTEDVILSIGYDVVPLKYPLVFSIVPKQVVVNIAVPILCGAHHL